MDKTSKGGSLQDHEKFCCKVVEVNLSSDNNTVSGFSESHENGLPVRMILPTWGSFLESPRNFLGAQSHFC